ncbi:MAG: hypothetical protein AB7I30_08115 [Isosphaeraceae bacterium]
MDPPAHTDQPWLEELVIQDNGTALAGLVMPDQTSVASATFFQADMANLLFVAASRERREMTHRRAFFRTGRDS